MSTPAEAILLCEGYRDRAFWKGLLLKLKCVDAPHEAHSAIHRFDKPGRFLYRTPSGLLLHVAPCGGDVKRYARLLLRDRVRKPLRRLAINVDVDDGDMNTVVQSIREIAASAAGSPTTVDVDGDVALDGGATLVSAIPWHIPGAGPPGVPDKQTLERLVCAAIVAAHPRRGAAVHEWLTRRPDPNDTKLHKAYAWSYMAGWHAELECDAFYSNLWDDQPVAAELEKLLRTIGAWRIAEALVH